MKIQAVKRPRPKGQRMLSDLDPAAVVSARTGSVQTLAAWKLSFEDEISGREKTAWPPGDAHVVLSVGGCRGFCILGTNPELARDGRCKRCRLILAPDSTPAVLPPLLVFTYKPNPGAAVTSAGPAPPPVRAAAGHLRHDLSSTVIALSCSQQEPLPVAWCSRTQLVFGGYV
ncbi:hypothetical protein MG293_003859 [Ovis ammon polii]|uniref:Uncharacterized protein n=1 Tax=Ovis ammon polii TaxID=230172 RepID=A0AAD4UM82_OVIAM|nr:hypothetical protein MG293_003859 [Ovis ammon polii]